MAELGNQEFPTIIGQDASFKGEMSFEKGLRIEGKFEGKVNSAGRLHVAKDAKLMAEVTVGAIIVEGEVKGNLTVQDRIEFKASARYEGDLRASKLVVDEGATFSGNVTVGPGAVKREAGMPPAATPTAPAGPAARPTPPAKQ